MACFSKHEATGYHGARLVVWMLAVVLFAGCSSVSRQSRPAAVEDRGPVPESTQRGSETQIAAYTPPAAPRIARAEPNRAVGVLVRRADDQRRGGDFDGATVSLERALRIAPDDALLWQRLAEVRADQRRPELVVQLAAKSNALADPTDRSLRQRNWTLIAQARRALGDDAGARDAEGRAASLR